MKCVPIGKPKIVLMSIVLRDQFHRFFYHPRDNAYFHCICGSRQPEKSSCGSQYLHSANNEVQIKKACVVTKFAHQSIHLSIHSAIHSFIQAGRQSVSQSSIHSFIHKFIHSFIHSIIHPSILSFNIQLNV